MPRQDQLQLLQLSDPVLQKVLRLAQPHLFGAAKSCKRLRNACRALPGLKVRLKGADGLSLVQLPADETFSGCTYLEYHTHVLHIPYITLAVQHAAFHWPKLATVAIDLLWSPDGHYANKRLEGAMAPILGFLAQLPSLRCLVLSPVLDFVSLVPLARLTQLEALQLNLAPLVLSLGYHHLAALSCLTGLRKLQLIVEEPFDLSTAVRPLTRCLPASLTCLSLNHHPWVAQWVPFIEDCTELRILRLLATSSRGAPVDAHPSALIHALAPALQKLECLQVLWDRPQHQDFWLADPSPSMGAPPLSPEDGFYAFPTAAWSSLQALRLLDGTADFGLVLPTPWHWQQLAPLTGLQRLLGVRMLAMPEEGVALRGVTQLGGMMVVREVTAMGLLLPALPALRGLTLRVEAAAQEEDGPLDVDVAQLQQLLQQQEQEAHQQQQQQQQPGVRQQGPAAAASSAQPPQQQPQPEPPPPPAAGGGGGQRRNLHAVLHLNIGNLAAHWGWCLMRRQLQLRRLENLELVWPIDSNGHLPDLTGCAASLTSLTFRLTWEDWSAQGDGASLVLEDILGIFSGLHQLQELELVDLYVVKPNMVLFLQHALVNLRRVTLKGRFDLADWEEGKMQALLRPQLQVQFQLAQPPPVPAAAPHPGLIEWHHPDWHQPAEGYLHHHGMQGVHAAWAEGGGGHEGYHPDMDADVEEEVIAAEFAAEEDAEEDEEEEEDEGYSDEGWASQGPSEGGSPPPPHDGGHEHAADAHEGHAGYGPGGHYEAGWQWQAYEDW